MKPQTVDKTGQFKRPVTQFRDWVSSDDEAPFSPDADRYHLYVSWACPWAHRTLISRSILGLDKVISISAVDALLSEKGWFFSDADDVIKDTVNHAVYLSEIYEKAKSNYQGRYTVPILWDKKEKTIVNNESREILRMFCTAFSSLHTSQINLSPEPLKEQIDSILDQIYEPINNGVYRCGFATTQEAYSSSVTMLFEALDRWDDHLKTNRYLCGDAFTEADICLFTTLYRFDLVYITHFKCNIKRLVDYTNLWNYVKEIYQLPGVKETCHSAHIKAHYFGSHRGINPFGIIPDGPNINFDDPFNRPT
jgi:glutathionyl-hydroquinone reductase